MYTVHKKNTKTIVIFSLTMIISFWLADISYSELTRLTDDPPVASPGYLNAAKQKTENILKQSPQKISLLKATVEFLKNQFAVKLAGISEDTPKAKLQKKSSVKVQDTEAAKQETEGQSEAGAAEEEETDENAAAAQNSEETEEPAVTMQSHSVAIQLIVPVAIIDPGITPDSGGIEGDDRMGSGNDVPVFTQTPDSSFNTAGRQQYIYIPMSEKESKFFEYDGTLVFAGRGGSSIIYALNISSLFREMLKNKGYVDKKDIALQAQDFTADVILETNALGPYVGSEVPLEGQTAETQAINVLANIIENPNDTEQGILVILKDILEKDAVTTDNEQLKEAEDNFMQMAVSIFLAQALPDLLNDNDMALIKGIFNSLNQDKKQIIKNYEGSIHAYYDNIRKVLIEHMSTLQLRSIMSNDIGEMDIERMPSNEIDRILRRIKEINDRTDEEGHILAKESEYREIYVEPAKACFEQQMRVVLNHFTRRLYAVLEGANLVKEEDGKTYIDLTKK